jgi:RNA polymerase sigma factor (sigma-70 family)
MGHTIAMTDGELLEASRRGERDAFGALVERYQDVICAITYSRTRDQALSEDVAQDTFIAAWKQLDQLREPGRLRSWLCGIARNLARKARRRSDRETPIDVEADVPLTAAGASPFEAVSGAQAERVVGEALSKVPETYRDVLVLYYREQRSVREVSEALGISEAATLQRLARGRQYLADGLSSLVERSLRAQRKPRRDLAAAVVAALPIIAGSRVATAATVSHGGSMLKLAIAAVLVSAAGTTAVVVHNSRGESPAAAPAAASAATADSAGIAPPARAPSGPAAAAAPAAPSLPAEAPAEAPTAGEPTPCPSDPNCKDARRAAPDSDEPVPAAKIAKLGLERGPSRGPANAPVTVVVFTDVKCKYCGGALGLLDQMLDEYAGKLRVVSKQMPLKPTTEVLAQALFAAEAQGKYWELHDLMLANQEDLTLDATYGLAQQVGLDVGKLRAAVDQGTYRGKVDAEKAAALELGVQGTPAFFINGRPVTGLRAPADFRAHLDRALDERR